MKNKISYCLFTYNQQDYIGHAIAGALAQTYSPLEIVISDDCSTDQTFEVILAAVSDYKGPHSIVLNRNEKNMGLGAHFSKLCRELATGNSIVILGGDDISRPEHVAIAAQYLEQYPDIMLIDFNADYINSLGESLTIDSAPDFDLKKFYLKDYLALQPIPTFAPGRIFRKTLMTGFDPIAENCPTEDSVLVLRSLLSGGLMRTNKNLVYYRRHETNISSQTSKLSNLAIISQYVKDVLQLFNEGNIAEQDALILLKRFMLEYEIRNRKYTSYTSKLHKFQSIIAFKWFLFRKRMQNKKYKNFELKKKPIL